MSWQWRSSYLPSPSLFIVLYHISCLILCLLRVSSNGIHLYTSDATVVCFVLWKKKQSTRNLKRWTCLLLWTVTGNSKKNVLKPNVQDLVDMEGFSKIGFQVQVRSQNHLNRYSLPRMLFSHMIAQSSYSHLYRCLAASIASSEISLKCH